MTRPSSTLEAKAVVDIPAFFAVAAVTEAGRVLFDMTDVALYLERVAAEFDKAGAVRDIGVALRAVTECLVSTRDKAIHAVPPSGVWA